MDAELCKRSLSDSFLSKPSIPRRTNLRSLWLCALGFILAVSVFILFSSTQGAKSDRTAVSLQEASDEEIPLDEPPPAPTPSPFAQIGLQFAQFFYQTFDTNRAGLTPLYGETSMLTFEGDQSQGAAAITQKLASQPFQTIQHNIVCSDGQAVPGQDQLVVSVIGTMVVNGATTLNFAEFFLLAKNPAGSYFALNDIMAWGEKPMEAVNAIPGEYKQIADQFAQFYYQTFDANRAGLAPLYFEQSLMTFEGQEFQGPLAITQKLTTMSFQTIQHVVARCDAQPVVGAADRIMLSVTGSLVCDGEVEKPMKFAQFFQLMKNPATGQWLVLNDIFRLNV